MDIFAIPDECWNDDVIDPSKGKQKDTIVQLVISLALGLSSFVVFCVSYLVVFYVMLSHTVLTVSGLETEMEELICRAKATERRSQNFT
jgi:hypothetical protein